VNIVEAYRKALKCNGQILSKQAGYYRADEKGIYFNDSNGKVRCELTSSFLSNDDFEVIEPPKTKYGFAEAWKMMEQGNTMKISTGPYGQYRIIGGWLCYCPGKGYNFTQSYFQLSMYHSKEWELL